MSPLPFHLCLSDALRQEIERITGVEVLQAAAEVEPATGTVVHAFTTGSMIQAFHLARRLPVDTPSGAALPTQADHDAGNTADSTPLKGKEH